MNQTKTLIFTTLFLLIFTLNSQAQLPTQDIGCCCDTRTSPPAGSIETRQKCTSFGKEFREVTAISDFGCTTICGTPQSQPGTEPVAQECSTQIATTPKDLTAAPVKGELKVRLDFTLPCQAEYVKISRCEGTDCTPQEITRIPPQQYYIDATPTLKWNTDYTYQVIARHSTIGDSNPATKIINTGDIECGYQYGLDKFCVDLNYYYKYQEYLASKGYTLGDRTRNAQAFQGNNFENTATDLFNGRFGKAFSCDPNNKLSAPALTCNQNQVCISTGDSASCIDKNLPCTDATNIFGLFSTIENCEFNPLTEERKYCFIDKSNTTIDNCYKCNSQMNCYDYKTEGTCTRDNCGLGDCAWKPTLQDIGAGVCIDQRFNNCKFCSQTSTQTAPNKDAYNTIFDKCTPQKAQALSTDKYPCFYQDIQETAQSCDTIACRDYTIKTQCTGGALENAQQGITLNPDNSIKTPSQDACSIQSCQWAETAFSGGIHCVKNADASRPGIDEPWQDCDDKQCEQDYFAPTTTIIPTGPPGITNTLLIQVTDKTSKTTPPTQKQGPKEINANYATFVCTYAIGGTPCNKPNFAATNATKLNINDETLKLQDHKGKELATVSEGFNKIRYYSKDPSKNLEIIKETTFKACKNCAGPQIIDFTINNAKLVNGIYYTPERKPTMTVLFNKQAEITTLTINKSTILIPLSQAPQTKDVLFTITTTAPQAEGGYTLTLNAKDNEGHYMNEIFVQPIFIKTSNVTVNITPPDRTVITQNSVTITLNFSETVTLTEVFIEEETFVGDYVKKINSTNKTSAFTTKNNQTFTSTITLASDGKKTIQLTAEDIAGAKVFATSTFYVNTKAPQIIMTSPRFGIAPKRVFNITIETTLSRGTTTQPAIVCRWSYDNPTAPPAKDFNFFQLFDEQIDNKHIIKNFNRITGDDTSKHNFYVYCKDSKGDITQKTFQLSVDTVAPTIQKAFAAPNPVAEEYEPVTKKFLTTLKVETDKETFCKYTPTAKDYNQMEGKFPGYEELPNTVNIADIIINQEKEYTYYVQCESIAGLLSQPKPIQFKVDTKIAFAATSKTPLFFNTTDIILAVESNKRAYCYYGTDRNALTTCMGQCNYTTINLEPIVLAKPGNHSYYAKCNRGTTGESSQLLLIKFTADNTPPKMLYVNDTSIIPDAPELSPYKNQILAAFKATDEETEVTGYKFSFKNARTGNLTLNWTSTSRTDGTSFLIPETANAPLVDGEKYFIQVRPINIVGLEGTEMLSDGITINFSRQVPGKVNGENCKIDAECISNFCSHGKCAQASCTDNARNGMESDKDCGGGECQKCDTGQKCNIASDCESGLSCSSNRCADLGPCFDAILTQTGIDSETDLDCGGACITKCSEGKRCKQTTDCATGLLCVQNTCKSTSTIDQDLDGIEDNKDKCKDTSKTEKADENGCSDSQKFSLGDEIPDSWRKKYFGCIDCPEAAADADPDEDRLTNIEEFRLGTNPTDPLDPPKEETSWLTILLWILLILLILGGLGIGGYALYQYYQSKQEKKPEFRTISVRPTTPTKPTTPQLQLKTTLPKISLLSDKIEALRKLIRPTTTRAEQSSSGHRRGEQEQDKEWLPLSQLHKKPEKEFKPQKGEKTSAFKKLAEIPQKKPATKVGVETSKEAIQKPLQKLQELALSRLTPEEREAWLKKLKLLRENKLGKEAIEQLLKKLKITSQYYNTHKEELQKQLQQWLIKK